MESTKGEFGKLTMNDFLIICSGMNDMGRSHSKNAFNNITKFIKSVNHSNIILINVPYRHDVMNCSHVNGKPKFSIINYLSLQKFFAMLM
jgi:hypothetical protein